MKPAYLNLKNKPTSRLLLLLCVLGVAAAAWWAWAAGPIRPNSAITTGQTVQAQTGLNGSGYTSINPAQTNSNASNGTAPVESSGSSTNPAVTGTEPSDDLCRSPGGGIQPDVIVYPCGCGSSGSAYPCCQYHPGVEIACPERL